MDVQWSLIMVWLFFFKPSICLSQISSNKQLRFSIYCNFWTLACPSQVLLGWHGYCIHYVLVICTSSSCWKTKTICPIHVFNSNAILLLGHFWALHFSVVLLGDQSAFVCLNQCTCQACIIQLS